MHLACHMTIDSELFPPPKPKQMADHERDFSSRRNSTMNNNYSSQHGPSEDSNRPGGASGTYLHDEVSSDEALRRIKTAGSITISPELFEKMYLTPQSKVSGDLRRTFGNPTPVALVGVLLSLTPLSCDLMGWRGAGGDGAAGVGSYYFFGGLLMFIGGLLEWILGNTFPFVVFASYGAFFFSEGATLTPAFNAYGAYSTTAAAPSEGLSSPAFAASYGFFLLFMGLLSLVFLICSLRTNLIFVAIFGTLVCAFGLLTGVYWNLALGNAAMAGKCQVAAGAFCFVCTLSAWWIFLAQMLVSVDFPLSIPVGDISHIIPGATERLRKKNEYSV